MVKKTAVKVKPPMVAISLVSRLQNADDQQDEEDQHQADGHFVRRRRGC